VQCMLRECRYSAMVCCIIPHCWMAHDDPEHDYSYDYDFVARQHVRTTHSECGCNCRRTLRQHSSALVVAASSSSQAQSYIRRWFIFFHNFHFKLSYHTHLCLLHEFPNYAVVGSTRTTTNDPWRRVSQQQNSPHLLS